MSIITNPGLQWDGKTPFSKEGRPLEAPLNWVFRAEKVEDEPAPYIHHRDRGFNIDTNHIRARLVWEQPVTIPAGTHYAIVHNFSHLTWGSDDFTIAWRVELVAAEQTTSSDDIWVARTKGDQSFAVQMDVANTFEGVFRVIFWTKWADSNGSLDLQKIDIQPQDWGVPTRQTLTVAGGGATVNEQGGGPTAVVQATPSTEPDTATENPAIAVAFGKLAAAMNECAELTQKNTDAATVAQSFRRLAGAFNEAADTIEQG
ncbi:MAG: hypothetical protein AAF653_07715 [Chloroflexota bacterium]